MGLQVFCNFHAQVGVRNRTTPWELPTLMLQGPQLTRFVSVGRVWSEKFHALTNGSPLLDVRRTGFWNKVNRVLRR